MPYDYVISNMVCSGSAKAWKDLGRWAEPERCERRRMGGTRGSAGSCNILDDRDFVALNSEKKMRGGGEGKEVQGKEMEGGFFEKPLHSLTAESVNESRKIYFFSKIFFFS